MPELITTAGDKLFAYDFTLKDAADVVVDITGATVRIKGQHETGTALSFTGTATVILGSAGTCRWTVQAGDIETPGRYYAEIEVEFSNGGISTFGDLVINAKKQLPRSS